MDERALRKLAVKSLSAMLGVVLFSAVFTRYNSVAIYANGDASALTGEGTEQVRGNLSIESYTSLETGDVVNSIYDRHLVIPKPSEETLEVNLEDLYMTRQIRVSICGLEEKMITKRDISSSSTGGDFFIDASVSYEYNPNSFLYTAVLDIQLDDVYAYKLYEDKQNIYVELWNPHEVYDRIIVLDAGHGGNDVGCYTKDMAHYEKDINLKIQKYLKELLDKEDIKVYYTRLTDEKVYLNPRVDLANTVDADMFISIHCNSSEYISAKGSEVLYSTKNQEEVALKSDRLAAILLDELVSIVKLDKRGTVNGDDIYIIGNSKVPIALIEVGFISNKDDLEFLKEKENQKLVAQGIYNGILKAYEEFDKGLETEKADFAE